MTLAISVPSRVIAATHRVTITISSGATRWSTEILVTAPADADHIDIVNLAAAKFDASKQVRMPPGPISWRVEVLR
jgi:hypothetical protein